MSESPINDRGAASIGRQILAGLVKDPSRRADHPIFHLVTLGRNLTVGSVALILLWAFLFRPPLGADQTRQIVQAIERGAEVQVAGLNRVEAKLSELGERVANQTTEVTRMQALAAGRYRCPTCPQCPDCRCPTCQEHPKSPSPQTSAKPGRGESTR